MMRKTARESPPVSGVGNNNDVKQYVLAWKRNNTDN